MAREPKTQATDDSEGVLETAMGDTTDPKTAVFRSDLRAADQFTE